MIDARNPIPQIVMPSGLYSKWPVWPLAHHIQDARRNGFIYIPYIKPLEISRDYAEDDVQSASVVSVALTFCHLDIPPYRYWGLMFVSDDDERRYADCAASRSRDA